MEELVQRFRKQLRNRQYEELGGTWLEIVESDLDLDEEMALLVLAEKYAADQAITFYSVLADSLKERGSAEQRLAVLQKQAELTPDDQDLAREIAACVQVVYSEVPDLERLLNKSGVGYGRSLKESLPKLNRYLSFANGALVYDSERGSGVVKKLDLLLDKVVVDFDMGAELAWDIAAAARRLRPAAPNGFYVKLRRGRQELLRQVNDEPGSVVADYLRDVGLPVTVSDIQQGLAQVVPGVDWEGFWNRARKEVSRNPHVQCRTSPARTYQWTDVPPDSPGDDSPRTRRTGRQQAGDLDLAGSTAEQLSAAYAAMTTFTDRRSVIEGLPEARLDEWPQLYAALFRIGRDGRARSLIEEKLALKRPREWAALLDSILTSYRRDAEAFLWLAENAERLGIGNARGLVSRILDLLESESHRSLWNRLRAVLAERDYFLVRAMLVAADEPSAARLINQVARVRFLDGFRAHEIVQLAVAKFPDLRAAGEENVIYTSAAGLDKAREELRRLTQEEIPRSAEEIAKARAHGDLSENYEYKVAKEKQHRLMIKAGRLRDEVTRARVVSPADLDTSEVSIGCRVRLTEGSGQAHEYVILGPWDTNPEKGIISYQTPFAGAVLGKKTGETVEIDGHHFAVTAIEPGL